MKENNNNRYTVKKIYKLEKKLNNMKSRDSEDFFRKEGLSVLQFYTITALTYPLIGLGVVADYPIWITLSPLILNSIPFAMGIDVLLFKKRLHDLENKLAEVHNNMNNDQKNELEELIVRKKVKNIKDSDENRRTRRSNTK